MVTEQVCQRGYRRGFDLLSFVIERPEDAPKLSLLQEIGSIAYGGMRYTFFQLPGYWLPYRVKIAVGTEERFIWFRDVWTFLDYCSTKLPGVKRVLLTTFIPARAPEESHEPTISVIVPCRAALQESRV